MTGEEEKEKSGESATEGILQGKKIIISLQCDADSLAQSGYGVRVEKTKLSLALYEALYLVSEKRLRVVSEDHEIEFQELLRKSRTEDPDVWSKYVLYRDLRSRGYVVREGSIGEVGFRVYERGAYPEKAAKYEVFSVRDGSPVSVSYLNEVLRSAEGAKKKLIVAVIDRHGEIVYYSLMQYSPY
ncbi:tRNA-intron lyase [Candidatus Bathyarchaeota archaeon]|nr:tRNA-intron lyase [Candidatus Bathyarchaeota archaeon]